MSTPTPPPATVSAPARSVFDASQQLIKKTQAVLDLCASERFILPGLVNGVVYAKDVVAILEAEHE